MTMYYYDGEWHIASSGMPDASGPLKGQNGITFADFFWKLWKRQGYSLPKDKDR